MDKINLWSYGEKGAEMAGMVAGIGTFCNWWLGGWDKMVQALVIFMALDVLLGLLAAAKDGEVDSHVMFWGGVNKLLVLCFVGVGVILDGLVGMNEPYIRTAVIWFYIGREGLSLVENYGKMGQKLPTFISKMLEQLRDQGDRNGK